jgi:hypothetical protein
MQKHEGRKQKGDPFSVRPYGERSGVLKRDTDRLTCDKRP